MSVIVLGAPRSRSRSLCPVTIPRIILVHLLAQFGHTRAETDRSGNGSGAAKPARDVCAFASFICRWLALGFGENREAVRDQVDRLARFAFDFAARLTDAPGDADKIADCGFGDSLA